MERIRTIADVSRIYREEHINTCTGCVYQNAASCGEDRVPICNKQYQETK